MTEVPNWLKEIVETNKCPRCSHRLIRRSLVHSSGEVAEFLMCARDMYHFRVRTDTWELVL